jgi:hypothetical protein
MRRRIGSSTGSRPGNPGGERSPWKKRVTARWQRRRPLRTRRRSKASRLRVTEEDDGNGVGRGGTTARRQRPQRCGTAVDGGTSSKGVKAQPGKHPPARPPPPARFILRVLPPGRRGVANGSRKRCEPLPAPGCNKPGTSFAEKTVGVVRNHEGGTSRPEWHPADRRWRQRHREWTRTRDVGGGDPSSESQERQVPATQATAGQALRIESGALKARRRSGGTPPNRSHEQEKGARAR